MSFIRNIYFLFSRSWLGCLTIDLFRLFLFRDLFHSHLFIRNNGSVLFRKKEVIGKENVLEIGEKTLLYKNDIIIHGCNNTIKIGNNCKLGRFCKIFLYGNNMEMIIGDNTTFTHDDELLLQEDGSKMIIGKNCLFSHDINIRTSDAHPIYDINTNKRCNSAKNVIIGDNVWITPNCIIQKGVTIGSGSIIASNSIVTKNIPSNCVAAGMPAKTVREGVYWKDELKI